MVTGSSGGCPASKRRSSPGGELPGPFACCFRPEHHRSPALVTGVRGPAGGSPVSGLVALTRAVVSRVPLANSGLMEGGGAPRRSVHHLDLHPPAWCRLPSASASLSEYCEEQPWSGGQSGAEGPRYAAPLHRTGSLGRLRDGMCGHECSSRSAGPSRHHIGEARRSDQNGARPQESRCNINNPRSGATASLPLVVQLRLCELDDWSHGNRTNDLEGGTPVVQFARGAGPSSSG